MMTFSKTHVNENRGTRTYQSAEGVTLYLPKSAGDQPDSFSVDGLNAPTAKEPTKAKLTPEERKAEAAKRRAENASLTPAQRAAKKLADAQARVERAQKAANAAEEKAKALETPAAQ